MLLKNVLWNIFQDTGRIEAYLYYRSCQEGECEAEQPFLMERETDAGDYKQ